MSIKAYRTFAAMRSAQAVVLAACFVFVHESWSAEEPKSPQPATAQAEPRPDESRRFDFAGDTPGVMTLAEFRKKYADAKPQAPQMPPTPFDQVEGCEQFEFRGERYGMTLATFTVDGAHYQFLDGVLFSARLTIHKKDPKGLIVKELTKRYGMPKTEELDFIGKVMTWNNGVSRIDFMEKVRNVTFTDNALHKKYDERLGVALKAEMEAQKKATKDASPK